MTDVALLQIQVDSQPVLTAAQNLAALSSTATRAEKVLGNLAGKKFTGLKGSTGEIEREFKDVEGIVNAFVETLDKVEKEFNDTGAGAGKLKKDAKGVGTEFSKLSTSLLEINKAGGAESLGAVAATLGEIATSSRSVATPIKFLAKNFKSLRTSASGISKSSDSFKTSLNGLKVPAASSAKSLQATATAAAALNSSLSRLGRLNPAETLKKAVEGATIGKEAFQQLITPIENSITKLVEFGTSIQTSVGSITQLREDIEATAKSFGTIDTAVQKLNTKATGDAFKNLTTNITELGNGLKTAVPRLKAFVKFWRALRDATKGQNARLGRLGEKFNKLATSLNDAAPALEKVTGQSILADEALRNVGTSAGATRKQIQNFAKETTGVDRLSRSVGNLSRATRGAFGFLKQFATGIGLISGGFAVALALRGFISALRDFELQAAKTAAVAVDLSQSFTEVQRQQEALSEQARSLGASTRFTAVEAAEAQFFLARAGFEVNEVLEATPATLNLAAAGYIGLGEAADIASNVLQQFNLETFQLVSVTDTLVSTANSANTSVQQMAQALAYAGPFAASLGVSVDQASAAIGALGNAGIQGSLAGTNLRGILISLVSPSREAGETLDKLAARIGQSREAFNVTALGLEQVIRNLRDATQGSKDAALEFAEIFNRRNVSGALALTQNVEEFGELLDTISRASGEAQRVAEDVDNTLAGAFLRAKSAATELALSVGDEGVGASLRDFTDGLASALRFLGGSEEGFKGLSREGQRVLEVIDKIGSALSGFGIITGLVVLGNVIGVSVSAFLKFGPTAAIANAALSGTAVASKAAETGLKGTTAATLLAARANKVLASSFAAISITNPVIFFGGLIAGAIAYGTSLFDLQDPLDKTNTKIEESNRLTEEQINLRERLNKLSELGGDFSEISQRVSRLRDNGAATSVVVAETTKLQNALKAVRVEIQATRDDNGGVLFGDVIDAIPSFDTLTGAASALQERIEKLREDKGIQFDDAQVEDTVDGFNRAASAALGLKDSLEQLATSRRLETSFVPVIENLRSALRSASEGDLFNIVDIPDLNELKLAAQESVERSVREGLLSSAQGEVLTSALGDVAVRQIDAVADNARVTFSQVVRELEVGLVRASSQRGLSVLTAQDLPLLEQAQALLEEILSLDREILEAETQADARRVASLDAYENLKKATQDQLKEQNKLFAQEGELSGLSGVALKFKREELEIAEAFAETNSGIIPDEVKRIFLLRQERALRQEAADLLDKEQEKLNKLVDRAANRSQKEGDTLEELRRQAGISDELTDAAIARTFAQRELLKVNIENADAEERARKALEEQSRIAQRNKRAQAGVQVIIDQQRETEKLESQLLDIRGIEANISAEVRAQALLREENASVTERERVALIRILQLQDKIRRDIKIAESNQVLDDLRDEIGVLEQRLALGGELNAQLQAQQLAVENGREGDAAYINLLTLLLDRRRLLEGSLEFQTDFAAQKTATRDFLRAYGEETDAILRQVGVLEELTVAQEAANLVRDEGLTTSSTKELEQLIAKRREATALLERDEQVKRLNQERTEAITRAQEDLAGSLLETIKGAKSAEEAFLGFAQAILEAILKAKIFQALGATGLFDDDGPLGSLITEGIISRVPEVEQEVTQNVTQQVTEEGIPDTKTVQVTEVVLNPAPDVVERTVIETRLDAGGPGGGPVGAPAFGPGAAPPSPLETPTGQAFLANEQFLEDQRELSRLVSQRREEIEKQIDLARQQADLISIGQGTPLPLPQPPGLGPVPGVGAAVGQTADAAEAARNLSLAEQVPLIPQVEIDQVKLSNLQDSIQAQFNGLQAFEIPVSPGPLGPPVSPETIPAFEQPAGARPASLSNAQFQDLVFRRTGGAQGAPLNAGFGRGVLAPTPDAGFLPPSGRIFGDDGNLLAGAPARSPFRITEVGGREALLRQFEDPTLPGQAERRLAEFQAQQEAEFVGPPEPVTREVTENITNPAPDVISRDVTENITNPAPTEVSRTIVEEVELDSDTLERANDQFLQSRRDALLKANEEFLETAPLPVPAVPAVGLPESVEGAEGALGVAPLAAAGAEVSAAISGGASAGAATLTGAGTSLSSTISTGASTAASALTGAGASLATALSGAAGAAAGLTAAAVALQLAADKLTLANSIGAVSGGLGVPNPTSNSYKGNAFGGDGLIPDNRYYSGGIPGIEDLPKIGSIPATFRGEDGSVNTLREGGSSEAILPLARDNQGRLGVRMAGGEASNNTTQNITTNQTVQNFSMTMPEDTFGRSDRQRRRLAERQSRKS